jgi:sulfate adenylyltransferase subunit 1 (EFTu-like GTPase family)
LKLPIRTGRHFYFQKSILVKPSKLYDRKSILADQLEQLEKQSIKREEEGIDLALSPVYSQQSPN